MSSSSSSSSVVERLSSDIVDVYFSASTGQNLQGGGIGSLLVPNVVYGSLLSIRCHLLDDNNNPLTAPTGSLRLGIGTTRNEMVDSQQYVLDTPTTVLFSVDLSPNNLNIGLAGATAKVFTIEYKRYSGLIVETLAFGSINVINPVNMVAPNPTTQQWSGSGFGNSAYNNVFAYAGLFNGNPYWSQNPDGTTRYLYWTNEGGGNVYVLNNSLANTFAVAYVNNKIGLKVNGSYVLVGSDGVGPGGSITLV